MNQDGWSRTLHSSWTGIILTTIGLALFLALTVILLVANGLGLVTGTFLVVAGVACIVVLRDMPIATEFGTNGIVRRTLLRRHHLAWSDVSRLERVRSGVVRTRSAHRGGGLAAKVGARRYPLTDRMESAVEFDLLRDAIGHDRSDALGLRHGIRPVDGRTPTWQYRRRRWHLR